ncbi:MAG TPA: ATP-dependent DNA helicase RecG, partial [Cytophagales bacterium]|nr:ATP-dependent DNA helicase RecG [Cytophagales bacterium]
MSNFFETRIEFLKGVGPQKAALLNKELEIFTYGDLIQHYPFRYEDRSKFYTVREVHGDMPYVQLRGQITKIGLVGQARGRRLVAEFTDDTGSMELVWFRGVEWMQKKLRVGLDYVVFGKPNAFGRKVSLPHPELEPLSFASEHQKGLMPIYSSTEKLRAKYLDTKGIAKLTQALLEVAKPQIAETLPQSFIDHYKLVSKSEALYQMHVPSSHETLNTALFRLKFEEFFYIQLRLFKLKLSKTEKFRGIVLNQVQLLTEFYEKHLPFTLTGAQKRVIKEIYADVKSGQQMNRLLQGDVGSGKTMVAFITMLIAAGSGFQSALVAPTQILAEQHFRGLQPFAQQMGLRIAMLTGATKQSERKELHRLLRGGDIHLLVGTHALFEDTVKFKRLGLAIVDEQHRFGVAQRASLWQKTDEGYPHVLVMTATPIPRTLAMTLYGDLDVSVIDELPAGRKPIQTQHLTDRARLRVQGFLKQEIEAGRQAYVVYPLIEESSTLDLKDLMDGYESICRAFPQYPISIVHGRMKPEDKDWEMQRFVKGETKIMVATTVIEVGVNVPNASVMVIENAERFGLAQLHQLRGRVGRGAEQSYCILMSKDKLSKEGKVRLDTMVRTTDGFEIAEVDLKLRGPGDIEGTQQSGVADLLVADIAKDGDILQEARHAAKQVLDADPTLDKPENQPIQRQISSLRKNVVNWSRVS